MKTILYISVICLVFFMAGASSALSQTQEIGGYTVIRSATGGTMVCIGRWVQPSDVALPGVCDGEIMDLGQLSAISAKQSADRLDHVLAVLSSIEQRLATNNELVLQLIETTNNTQTSINRQVTQGGEFLRDTIARRFEELPKEILADDLFKEELAKLKENILEEVEKQYLTRQASPKK